jgi:hypothetical protein
VIARNERRGCCLGFSGSSDGNDNALVVVVVVVVLPLEESSSKIAARGFAIRHMVRIPSFEQIGVGRSIKPALL